MDVASTRKSARGARQGGRSRFNAPLATNIDDKENLMTKKLPTTGTHQNVAYLEYMWGSWLPREVARAGNH